MQMILAPAILRTANKAICQGDELTVAGILRGLPDLLRLPAASGG